MFQFVDRISTKREMMMRAKPLWKINV